MKYFLLYYLYNNVRFGTTKHKTHNKIFTINYEIKKEKVRERERKKRNEKEKTLNCMNQSSESLIFACYSFYIHFLYLFYFIHFFYTYIDHLFFYSVVVMLMFVNNQHHHNTKHIFENRILLPLRKNIQSLLLFSRLYSHYISLVFFFLSSLVILSSSSRKNRVIDS